MAAKRASYLMRIDPAVMGALRRWADDDLRSMNAQLDFIIRQALKQAGRLPERGTTEPEDSATQTPASIDKSDADSSSD